MSLGAPTTSYRQLVQKPGKEPSMNECIGVFVAAAPIAGSVRIDTGAPRLAAALGYDADQALE